MIIIHHEEIRRRIKARYRPQDIRELLGFLQSRGTLSFVPLPSGLYPAAIIPAQVGEPSSYGSVWVRDNIYVALAHYIAGHIESARSTIGALATFYRKYRGRFVDAINGATDLTIQMNRPHVRFDGVHLAELAIKWPHAQNDALGYFLWMYCRLANEGQLEPDAELLALFALYFKRISYWQDLDSGHWEEARKVEASSIGAVVAGLRALRRLMTSKTGFECRFGAEVITIDFIDDLIKSGEETLSAILPWESLAVEGQKGRQYDAALLLLIYPLEVVDSLMEKTLLDGVLKTLQGAYGIRRYLGDSYWTADYKEKLPLEIRISTENESQSERDAVARPGEEAQWCIFDPIVSVVAGQRHLKTGDPVDLEQAVYHLNRALGQITGSDCSFGELRCPEAYYLEHGRYVPNDQTPLLWTQANLWIALLTMLKAAEGMA